MLTSPPKATPDREPQALAVAPEGSQPAMPANSIMAALIAEHAESRVLCALVASSIVSNASSTCGARGAIAAAFDDLATLQPDVVGEILLGGPRPRDDRDPKTC